MHKIYATQRIPYGKKHYAAGEEIPATEKDAALLVKIGKARHAEPLSRTDLPAAAMSAATAPEPGAPFHEPEEEAAPEAQPDPRSDTRDMARTGPTGQARPSRSSRPGRPQKAKI